MHLSTVEDKVYSRYVRKHIQRQGHLGESTVYEMGHVGRGEREGRLGKGNHRRETHIGVAGQNPEMLVTDVGKMLSNMSFNPEHPKWNGKPVREKIVPSHRGKVSLALVIGAKWT